MVDDLRLVRRDRPHLDAALLWSLVTTRPAAALGLAADVGRLARGGFADAVAFPVETGDPLAEVLDGDATPLAVWVGGERQVGTRIEPAHLDGLPARAACVITCLLTLWG